MADKTIETNVLGWSFAGWRRFAMSAKEDGRAFPATILCFGAKAAELHHALDAIAKEHLIRRLFEPTGESSDPGIADIAAAGARATLTGFWRKRREDDPVPPGGHAGEWVFVAKDFTLAAEEPLHLNLARQRNADEAARKARTAEEGDAFQKRWNSAFGDLFEEAMAGFGRMGSGSKASGSNASGAFVSAADREHLDALGLSAMPASKDELHQAYKSAMKRWHPDAGTEPDGGKAAKANAARDALSAVFA